MYHYNIIYICIIYCSVQVYLIITFECMQVTLYYNLSKVIHFIKKYCIPFAFL